MEKKERRRRKALENHKIVRKTIMGNPREEPPFYRLGIRVSSREGHQESTPKSPFGIPKKFKKINIMWRRILKSHMPKDSPRKIGNKSLWY